MLRILIIDNHDSFVYNLVQLARETRESYLFRVILASQLNGDEHLYHDALIISPGPGLPNEQPKMMQTLRMFVESKKPILGICLGCQAIAIHFGYQLKQLAQPLHGHTSQLRHSAEGILSGLEQEVDIGRYHSWVVDLESNKLGDESPLIEHGYTLDNDGKQTMVIAHKQLPIWGLQFHPESMISTHGNTYLSNWFKLIDKSH